MLSHSSRPVDLVRLATVQIWMDGRYAGTGFFLDRHTVITCAHVVHGGPRSVMVVWKDRDFPAEVVVLVPAEPGAGEHYEFPDLAFLTVGRPPDHPRSRLTDSPLVPDVLTAVGYSQATPQPGVQPDELRLTVAGRSGQYLRVKDDEVVDGMSGSPAVDDKGVVHGVVKASRDYGRPRGGWIIPATYVATCLQAHSDELARRSPIRPATPVLDDSTEDGARLRRLLMAQRVSAERMPYKLMDGPAPALSSVYVELTTERRERPATTLTAREDEERSRPVLSVREMVSLHRHTLLVGGPGAGKSSLLLRIVAETADWLLGDPAAPVEPPFGWVVPIRIPATALLDGRQWGAMMADAVHSEMGELLGDGLPPGMFDGDPWPGLEWLLLIDGLDEVMDPDRRQRLTQSIAFYMSGYGGHWRFLVASRSLLQEEFAGLRARGTEIGTTLRFDAYVLRPFDAEGLAAFAANWFTERDRRHAGERTAAFLERVSHSQLSHLVRVPLLATIAAIVYETNPADPLPVDRTGLYERFVRGLLYERPARREVLARLRERFGEYGPSSELLADILVDETETCLEDIAAVLIDRDDEPDATDLGLDWLRARVAKLPVIPALVQHMRWLLLSTGLLVVAWDRVDFVHRGFAEYLAAGRTVRLGFEPGWWLRRVRRRGLDNMSMFAFVRWTRAGHDPVPVLIKLLVPGRRFDFPMLVMFCAVIEDGLPLGPEAVDRLTKLALRALRVGRLDTPTVTTVLLSLSTRTPGTAVLSAVAGSGLSPPWKRLVAARLLAQQATTAADRALGARVLVTLGHSRLVLRWHRHEAWQTLARSGDAQQQRYAIEALARVVETAATSVDRYWAIDLLAEIGQETVGRQALLRRAAQLYWPADRSAVLDYLVDLDPGNNRLTVEVSRQQVLGIPAHLRSNLVGAGADRTTEAWTYSVRRPKRRDSRALLTPAESQPRSFADRLRNADPQLSAEARVAALVLVGLGPAEAATLLAWARSARQPTKLRIVVLATLPSLALNAAGARVAQEILDDPAVTGGLAVRVCLVLAWSYGRPRLAADGLARRVRRSDSGVRVRALAGLAWLAVKLARVPDGGDWPSDRFSTEQLGRAAQGDDGPFVVSQPRPEPATNTIVALDGRYAALPVTAPVDDDTVRLARSALSDQQASAVVAAGQERAVANAWLAGRCPWWAELRAELKVTEGSERAARLALAVTLVPAATGQARSRAKWAVTAAGERCRRGTRSAVGDLVTLAIALLATYATTAAAAAATLRYGHHLPNAFMIGSVTTIQTRLAVPVLALIVALAVRPRRPIRDLLATGQVPAAAALFTMAAAWFGADSLWLPIWSSAVAPLTALNEWLGAAPVLRSSAAGVVTIAAGFGGLILADTLGYRAGRTSPPARPEMWTVLRLVVLFVAAGWLLRAGGLDSALTSAIRWLFTSS